MAAAVPGRQAQSSAPATGGRQVKVPYRQGAGASLRAAMAGPRRQLERGGGRLLLLPALLGGRQARRQRALQLHRQLRQAAGQVHESRD